MTPESNQAKQSSEWAADRLGSFVAAAPRTVDAQARERSRLAILDTIGCALLGRNSPEAKAAFEAVRTWGGGEAQLIGRSERLPPPWAAFVNATAAHSLDFDDWDDPSLTHTSAILLPAILAASSTQAQTIDDLIDAHIVGVEVLMRIGEALNPSHYWAGWHSTSTIGALGAAAAVARLQRLDEKQVSLALSIASSLAGGFVSQFGTMTKPAHAGFAAKAGVLAAAMAKAGFTAERSAIDGPVSLRSTMSTVGEDSFEVPLSKLGNPWAILEHGLHVKLYPSCGGTHRVIEAAIRLHRLHRPAAEEIESLVIHVPAFMPPLLPYLVPESRPEALFSFPYCTAAGLLRGKVGIEEFSDEILSCPQILSLAAKARITTREAEYDTRLFAEGDFDVVTIEMRDGRSFSAAVDIPYGAPPRLASAGTVREKFIDCASRAISFEKAEEIAERLLSGDPTLDIEALFESQCCHPPA